MSGKFHCGVLIRHIRQHIDPVAFYSGICNRVGGSDDTVSALFLKKRAQTFGYCGWLRRNSVQKIFFGGAVESNAGITEDSVNSVRVF